MSLTAFSDWLYETPFSTVLRETTWAIPNLQTIHILAICVIVGSALATELRMAGLFATDRALPNVLNRYLPWMKWALVVLLATGLLLVIAEPGRTLNNTLFWIKMALVAGASLVTLRARRTLVVDHADGPDTVARPEASRGLSWLMLLVWVAIIFCGRFIAYV
ncbi:DUF6644 family protein [Croceicoccus sediminis]|uniref:DUF6644 family protein n=1 Tax=Croceicoccus sediminis TaxID=2571150 RepID=UPI001183545E|nr:DUF6644 family protein [Croceicoccus sediminis]